MQSCAGSNFAKDLLQRPKHTSEAHVVRSTRCTLQGTRHGEDAGRSCAGGKSFNCQLFEEKNGDGVVQVAFGLEAVLPVDRLHVNPCLRDLGMGLQRLRTERTEPGGGLPSPPRGVFCPLTRFEAGYRLAEPLLDRMDVRVRC